MAKEQELSVQVYDLVQSMKHHWDPIDFFKQLLMIYGTAKRSVNQAVLNDRAVNVASEIVEPLMECPDLAIKQRAYFRFLKNDEDVAPAVDKVKLLKEVQNQKNRIQFIICCSSNLLYLYDLVLNDGLSIDLDDLPDNYAFLLPIKDGRRDKIVSSQEADKKACLKLTRLLDTLAKFNNIESNNMQKLNSFIRRILFCFFAEDTGIFNPGIENMFTNAFDKLVDKHGTNAKTFFEDLFEVLNTKYEDREELKARIERESNRKIAAELLTFPYVNGGLFRDKGFIPDFNLATRNQLIDCGRLAWHEISPAIFGAMFQGAMKKDDRRTLGAHYTSEENILKVIRPLFLDKLYSEFEALKVQTEPLKEQINSLPELKKARSSYEGITISGNFKYWSNEAIKLETKRRQVFKDFLTRIGKLKFLDPACGCGNFLLISYKELRKLENEVISYIEEGAFGDSYVNINQFYGIEIEDWPAEIAHVSMWLMQHLMNQEANSRFGTNIQSIPLKSSATIVTANALTTDWETIIPAEDCSYILGNPPYSGAKNEKIDQKENVINCYPKNHKIGQVDLVSAWFIKASDYTAKNKNIECAFVATNSICQGEQVKPIWGLLQDRGIKINFAYTSFPWENEAKNNAAVICIIIGFSYKNRSNKFIVSYDTKNKQSNQISCRYISPYLTPTQKENFAIIEKQKNSLCNVVKLEKGHEPTDDGKLIFDFIEGQNFMTNHPSTIPLFKKYIGSKELINREHRWTLWLTEENRNIWENIPEIKSRIALVEAFRKKSTKASTVKKAETPWKFGDIRKSIVGVSGLAFPLTSSGNRIYIPLEFVKADSIISNGVFLMPNASNYDFGILTSKMHMIWNNLAAGKLKSDYRYSRELSYNTFIWPNPSDAQKAKIEDLAKQIRKIRNRYPTLSLGDLYSSEKMPEDLKEAHNNLDMAVEDAYREEPFKDDDERLAFLLDLYSEAIANKESK